MSKTATFIRSLGAWPGAAALYRVSPPLPDRDGVEHDYVIASAITLRAVIGMEDRETYLFPADADGENTSWGEMPGSRRGTLDHAEVFQDLGYAVKP